MPDNPIEILGARERRRRWSVEEKLQLVAECEEPGATLRAVAARHDISPTRLRRWRRQVRRGQLMSAGTFAKLPGHTVNRFDGTDLVYVHDQATWAGAIDDPGFSLEGDYAAVPVVDQSDVGTVIRAVSHIYDRRALRCYHIGRGCLPPVGPRVRVQPL